MITKEESEIAAQGTIQETGEKPFVTFLYQPEVREAMARHIHAQARVFLWRGFAEKFGTRDTEGYLSDPPWLDKATEADWTEEEEAEYLLEVAIQNEVARRVEAALAGSRANTQAAGAARRDNLAMKMIGLIRQEAVKEREAGQVELKRAFSAAGLTKGRATRARKKPMAANEPTETRAK